LTSNLMESKSLRSLAAITCEEVTSNILLLVYYEEGY